MRLTVGHHQTQSQVQKMILAPKMIQSMEILQLPLMALQDRVQQEMEENPCLQVRETDPDLPTPDHEAPDSPDAPTNEERELVIDESHKEDDFDRLVSLSEEWDGHFEPSGSRPSSARMEEESDRRHDVMANLTSRPHTLQDDLCDQLAWFDLDSKLRSFVERIIYNLDGNGYMQSSLKDLLDPNHSPADFQLMQQALAVVQQLDPPGVGAHDLRECLLLQLTPDMEYFEELQTLISSHLDDIKDNRLPLIQRKTGYSIETIQLALEQLRQLKPKPGAEFASESAPSVTPDVFVEPDENGKYVVRVEEREIPNLYISPYYRRMLEKGDSNGDTKDFIKKKITSAQWLIESIEQRRSTLLRVAQAIVDHQTVFLDKGPEWIEPLKMQQIADKVGVHVTTVSRAVDGKWIQTPRGLFPLKRFFGGGTTNAQGEEVAWDAIRLKLQEIIDGEDKTKPFSDDALVTELEKHGLKVARRTVTKYRQAMDIASSRQRREWTSNGNGKAKSPETNGHSS
ncbi:RNA polymerase subunit [Planctomycetales bacterium 10988]|nr:RNA polymerase subunit [Planctomycetales bacterium 10988]